MKTAIVTISADWENFIYRYINSAIDEEEQAKNNLKLSSEETEYIMMEEAEDRIHSDGFEDTTPITEEERIYNEMQERYDLQKEIETKLHNLFYEFTRKVEREGDRQAISFLENKMLTISNMSIKKKVAEDYAVYDLSKHILEKVSSRPNNIQKGFDLKLSDNKLEELCQILKKNGYLDNLTSEENFINAFNGKELSSDFKKLKWLKNKVNLSFFINILAHEHKWKTAEIIFESIKAGNLKKSCNNQQGLDKHKKENLYFHEILDGLRTV